MGNQKATPTKETTLTRPQNSANLATKFPLPTTSAHPLLQLQRKIGNRAVSQLIQAKLKVGKPNDVYEVEADRVADHVMRSPDPIVQLQPEEKKEETAQAKANVQQISPLVQREEEKKEETAQAKAIAPITPLVQRQETEEKKEETVQKQAADEKKEETAQMLQRQATDENKEETVQKQEDKKEETAQAKGADTPEVTPHLETRIQTMRGGGQPLPDHTRSFFESRMGYDLGGVRVHTDSQADEVSRGLNAQAFTIGQNIFFAGGRYEPQTNQGKWLLAHELTHTVQQTPSTPAAQTKLTPAPVSSQRKISVSLRTNGAIQLKGTGARSPRSAAQDPAFQTAVVKKTKAIAKQQKHHAPAKTKAAEAQAAAQPPANDLASKAAGKQVQQMDQQQPKPFNRAAFKAALLAKIAAAAPKNLKEADEFKESGKVSGVKGELTGQVDSSKKQSGGAIESQVKATPNPSGIETKVATPLPPTTEGAPPEAIDSTQAAPKPKTADEVSLQEGSQSLDRQMTDSKVTEEQLKKSNEPDFQAAADAKKGAQVDAVKAPMEFRKSEQASLNQAKTQAGTTAQTHLTGMRGTRGQLLNRVTGSQQQTKGEEEKQEALVANEVQGIYAQTKQKAEARLARLDTEVNQAFDQGATSAQQAFEDYVKRRMDDYKDKRYSGLDGAALWLRDKFLGVPSEVNQFFVEGRGLYIAKMDGVLDRVAALVETGLNEAKNEIATGRKAVQEHIQRRLKDFPEATKRATEKIKGQFDQLEQSVDDKQNQLIDSLAQKYNEKLQAIDARIDEMKAQNKGLVDAAKEAIGGAIKTIMEMKAMLLGILSKAADAIDKIIKDPISFLGNLVTGVKQGFLNFVGNIASHLQKGLMGWLLGALAETGIQLPESFDLKGIISLVMQVLGLTWAFIRSRAVKLLGEKVVKVLEMVAEPIKILITQGPAGLWEYIKDQLSTLKDTVIEGIKSFVTESIIKAGVTWIIGLLNPAGAFIKACKAIYDIVMFFVERGSQIITLVNAVVDSISAIANGATGVAAGLVENALSKALPVVISFLAALLGVSGITEKIRAIIAKVQAPVHKAIDWVIDKAVSLVKKAGKLLGFGKDKKDDQADPEHDKKVSVGMAQIHAEERKYAENGKISLDSAHKVASKVKSDNSVFKSITVVDGGNSWKYHYVASPEADEKSELGKSEDNAVPVAVRDKVRRRDNTWSNGVVESFTEVEMDGQKQKCAKILFNKSKAGIDHEAGRNIVPVKRLVNDFASSPDSLGMGGYAKGHSGDVPEHSKYEPKNRIETEVENGATRIKYGTVGGAQFDALISADQLTHSISGTKLALKDSLKIEGRGVTEDSPNFIANANLNRSHLIADRFLGSGYKSAANLVSASAKYNQVDMKGVEDQIVKLIVINKAKEFDLSVKVKLGELKKSDIVQQILTKVPAEEKDAVKESVEQFASKHPTFKVVLEVNYQVSLINADTNQMISMPFNLGADKYLKV